jgi:hypothetical protein
MLWRAAPKNVRRVIAVCACCLLAALTPFYAGVPAATTLGLVPLAVAVWLVARSDWSSRTRVIVSLAVPVVTIALLVSLVALSALTNYYN